MSLHRVVSAICALSLSAAGGPPPLSSLQGVPVRLDGDANAPTRDPPVLSHILSSVGTAAGAGSGVFPPDAVSLSQISLWPYVDVGVTPLSLTVDTHPCDVNSTWSTWSPTSIQRRCSVGGEDTIVSSNTTLAAAGDAVLLDVTLHSTTSTPHAVVLQLQAGMRATPQQGWTRTLPRSLSDFTVTARHDAATLAPVLLSCDALSNACAAWVIVASFQVQSWGLNGSAGVAKFTCMNACTFSLALVVANATSTVLARAGTVATPAAIAAEREAFDAAWTARWEDAFTPKLMRNGASMYSGSLPVVEMEDTPTGAALQRLYYMSCYTLLACERRNMSQLYPRVTVTAAGNAYEGIAIGGSVQFAWDASFASMTAALLDPAAVEADLRAWIGRDISSYFGIELDDMSMVGYFYAYNAISLYRSFTGYMAVTNDSAFAQDSASMLTTLATQWMAYTSPGSTLSDYCSDANCYLECVPTYTHAAAGLQAANVYMLRDMADMAEAGGNTSGAWALRRTADAIVNESISRMYVSNTSSGNRGDGSLGAVGGWWQCVDVGSGDAVEVRHVIDFVYTALGFCAAGAGVRPTWGCDLTASQREQMLAFAQSQLLLPSQAWMHALSTNDSLHYIARPDHGTTGAYDAWCSMAFDALTALSGSFSTALPFFVALSDAVTFEGPFGQAHEITLDGSGAFKTWDGYTRYIANNGAGYAESIIRTLFGYQPTWGAHSLPTPALANVSRGVLGSMTGIVGPDGTSTLTATLTDTGVVYEWV